MIPPDFREDGRGVLNASSVAPPPHSSCFCNVGDSNIQRGCGSWKCGDEERIIREPTSNLKIYSDKDLAGEMNALTFQERQEIVEEIHGVVEVIPETPEFIDSKIKDMVESLEYIPSHEKDAWQRAVFLRPSLAHDRRWFLTCLRARRFKPREAARLLANYYENKRKLFGDELLPHRVTWKDLTPQEKHILAGDRAYQVFSHREKTGRPIVLIRFYQWDVNSPAACKALLRAMVYTYSSFFVDNFPDEMMQRRGAVFVCDWRGSCRSSGMQLLQFVKTIATYADNVPVHVAGIHMLSDNAAINSIVSALWPLLKKDYRLRNRLHFGSNIETVYSLRGFGINFDEALLDRNQLSQAKEDADLQLRLQKEIEWLRSEEAFRSPNSSTALYPNLYDIIMGRNKKFGLTWPGTRLFHQMVQLKVSTYEEARDVSARYTKTKVALDILDALKGPPYHGRFLARTENDWQDVGDTEARLKISQALRKYARQQKTVRDSTSSRTIRVATANLGDDDSWMEGVFAD